MCDSIANGPYRIPGGSPVNLSFCQPAIPPMIYISNGNSLNTFYGLSASNLYSCNSFTNDLYISGNIYGANLITANISTVLNAVSITSQAYSGNGYGLSNLNASNLTGTISNTNLPPSGVVAGTYGSSANVSQVTVDQYGLVTAAANVGILSSQWTSVAGNVAYQNGVSIGTLSAPPDGSNLYVLGSANITDVLNVSTLYVNSATVFGSATLNVLGISNLYSVLASLYIGNGSGLSNLAASNLVGNVETANVASSVTDPAQPNITSLGVLNSLNVSGVSNLSTVLSSLYIGNGSGLSDLNASNLVGNVSSATVASSVTDPAQLNITSVGTLTGLTVSGVLQAALYSGNASGLSNLNSSNLVGNVASANVALVVSQPAQPNITSVGTLTGLTIQGLLVASNASGLSNLNSSNLVGNVAMANVALVVSQPAQPNITSVGTLTSLTVSGILQASLLSGNGSGISNINGSNVVSTVGTAQSVTNPAQPNITSVGTLTSLSVVGTVSAGTFVGDGQGLFGIHGNAIVDTVMTANTVVQPAQPNITSVGTLTGLTVNGLLIASNGSGISNINGANVSTVRTAQSVTVASQPNITSVGTLTSLTVGGVLQAGLITGNGSGISNINSSNLTGTISTGNLPVSGVTAGLYGSGANVSSVTVDQYGRITGASNVATQWTSNTGNTIYYANYVGIGSTFVPTANLHVIGNAYVSNSVTTTNIFFTNTIQATNLPTTTVVPGGYGSVANIPQIVVDQYGRLTSASNITLPSLSQWTSIDANVAFGNGVSIGTLSNPPTGSNLYVPGTANIGTINTSTLSISGTANIATLNVVAANLITANVGTLNVSGVSNLTSLRVSVLANLTTANIVTANIASGNLTTLRVSTLANIATGNLTTANIVTLNVSSAANISNLRVSTLANLVSANLTTSNITTDNVVLANIITANIGSLTVPGAFTSNATHLVFLRDVPYLNISDTANIANLSVTTFNASSIFVTNSNLVTANVTTENVVTLNASSIFVTTSVVNTENVLTLNASSIFATNSNLVTANVTTENVLTLNASSIFATNSNLVTANVTTENVLTLNASSIFATNSNLVTANVTTENVLTLNASSIFATNSNLVTANVTTENVLTLNASSIFATNSNLVTANVTTENVLTLNASSIFATNSNLVTANVTTENVVTLNASSIFATNSNLVTLNASSIFATNSNLVTLNASSIFATNSNLVTANVTTENVVTLNASSIFATNSNLGTLNASSIFATNSNLGTLNASSIFAIDSNLVTLNASSFFATDSNLVTLNVSSISVTNQANVVTLNTQFLTVTSNILPGTGDGNTYLEGNIIVSGNVFSALGMPLGSGGGYYFSLPADIALQTPYTGGLYGTTYPLSVGLSNGFTLNGTSTLITVTPNGNFQFGVAGPYLLRAVFNSTDNITGLAVGSNVADVHGTDQGYMYRYTTFITQNPTELIEIPFNVIDSNLYYYLDLFSTDGGSLRQTANTSGGTYMTMTPLTGGGLATGGPGGTPGTQWISSGSNIYYSNSVGIGAINPQYKLDVSGDLRVTGNIYGNVIGSTLISVVSGLTSNYTANVGDYYIGVNGARKVTLPLGSSISVGKSYIVKDEAGNASATSVLLQASGSDVIDGNSNVTMALNNISLTTLWTGSRWSLI